MPLLSQSGACLLTLGVISFVKSHLLDFSSAFISFCFLSRTSLLILGHEDIFHFFFLLEALKKCQLIIGIIHIKFTLLRHAGYCSQHTVFIEF